MLDNIYSKYNPVIFLDVETTGVDPESDKIIELSYIVTGDPDGLESGDIKVNDIYVKTIIPEEITQLTGISQEKVDKDGVSELEMVYKFMDVIPYNNPTLLIAHNAQFDISFIRNAFKRYGLEKFIDHCDYLDTLTVFKDRRPYPHKLVNAIEQYDLSGVENSHLAADDTLALFAFTKALAAERDDLDAYINLFGYNQKYGISGSELHKVFYMAQQYRKYMAKYHETLPALAGRIPDRVVETVHVKGEDVPKKETRIVIKGDVINYDFFKNTINRLFPSGKFTIVSGGENKGIDPYSEQLAKEMELKKVVFEPDWKKYHRSAAHVRNSSMLKYAAEANGYLVIFGQEDALKRQAEKKGMKVIEI